MKSRAALPHSSATFGPNDNFGSLPPTLSLTAFTGGINIVSGGTLSRKKAKSDSASYDPANRVQIIGHGDSFKPEYLSRLTDDERYKLLRNQ